MPRDYYDDDDRDYITIDPEALRRDLVNDSAAAYYAGGWGAAAMQAIEAEHASPERLVQMAQERGVDLFQYQVPPDESEDW